MIKKKIKRSEKAVGNELAELQHPKEAKWDKGIIVSSRALNNALAATGIILSFQGNSDIGAGLLGVYPITEFVITSLEKSLEKREGKWNEFLNDADAFSDNFNELLGIIKKIDDNSELGKTQTVKILKARKEELLKIYDKDKEGEEGYEEIDLEELIDKEKQTELAQDLVKDKKESKWWGIIEDIKKLENLVINYQKTGSLGSLNEKDSDNSQKDNSLNKNQSETVVNVVENSENKSQKEAIELQNLSSEQQTHTVQLPFGTPSSSK